MRVRCRWVRLLARIPSGKRFRALTSGEIAMASRLFGAAVDYARVRLYRRRYLPFGLQPVNCAMTPNGHLYFHASRCLDDFSSGGERACHWFMHEMVHVYSFAHRIALIRAKLACLRFASHTSPLCR
jgi:hypothetical protein